MSHVPEGLDCKRNLVTNRTMKKKECHFEVIRDKQNEPIISQ